jgi:hypothetical protein
MTLELVLFDVLVPAIGKFPSVHVLDCYEHSDIRTAVPPVAALRIVDLPVHNCNSQTVSTYGVSKTVIVSAVTAVTVLKFIYASLSVDSSYFMYFNMYLLKRS